MNFTSAVVPNTAMANTETTMGCSGSDRDANQQKRWVIKNNGTDVNSRNNLSFLPSSDYISSIRIGNSCYNAEAEALYYTMTVTPQNALVFIYYSIVLENSLHSASQNPEFIIRIKRQNPGSSVFSNISDTLFYCVQSPTSTQSLGVWILPSGGQAVYKPWAKAAINLYNYLYETIRIEVLIGDCSASGHYGYCYIAGDCQPMLLTASGCSPGASNEVATITAPKGLSGYQWYRSRYGELGSSQQADNSNYEMIPGTRGQDSILQVYVEDFPVDQSTGNRYQCNTFKCVLTSYLDPTKPIRSALYVSACNQKPTVDMDSVTFCDGRILVLDHSTTPTSEGPVGADTARSSWIFRDGSGRILGRATGGSASYTYPSAGDDSVTLVTVSPLDSTCYTERTLPVHIRKNPTVSVSLSRNNLCENDTITLTGVCNDPIRITGHKWVIGGDTISGNPVVHGFGATTRVEYVGTNADGCTSSATENVNVGYFPGIAIDGDTVVCIGSSNTLTVRCDIPNCTFEWYTDSINGSFLQSGATYTFTPTSAGTCFAQVTSPYGCKTWAAFKYRMLVPDLTASTERICEGDSVVLTGMYADHYTWEASPADASLDGQDSLERIVVHPLETTVYTMTGHGPNGCGATPNRIRITVDKFPKMKVLYTPNYVDWDNPTVNFIDSSSSRTHSTWIFPMDGTRFDNLVHRTLEYRFLDLHDSLVPVKLISTTDQGCASDTSFRIPVSTFSVWVPNVFTPDLSDNNRFGVTHSMPLIDYSFAIYDRRGLKVFESSDQNEKWDGSWNGYPCKQGSYIYMLKYRQQQYDDPILKTGTLLLLR